ncbi:hypothetical protein [Iodobacter fluviatilis]|uniref:Peptidase S1 domain-containing protein n=1 Tax=Iodobacter fluviatilis TaxID=537 RepID=A0A377Q8Y0_9NEIS|nr:hypothetical protein [Iodobacter fluviatilis]TCU88760.1 hypothetical protein EV682_103344 [Iodobacter fluviatilis]STQ91168.1 Uncharacterised protein [Iodobacter fluviatilis]
MCDIAEICRRVLFKFKIGEDACGYSGKGSSFLISSMDHCYWVAALHSIGPSPSSINTSINTLKVTPSDDAEIYLPFDEKYGWLNPEDQAEYKDICMLRVNLTEYLEYGDGKLKSVDIDLGFFAAKDLLQDEELFVVGYPAESNEVDYDAQKINNTRVVLKAKYMGFSEYAADYYHKIMVNSSIYLEDFDGLSGGPVFCTRDQLIDGVMLPRYLLVGMVIRGGASSGILRFIGSEVIKSIVDNIENIPT